MRDEKDLNLTVNTILQNWTDKLQIPKAMLYTIYLANFTFTGFSFTKCRDSIVALMSAKINDDPDRSCALVIPPNTGPYKSAYDSGAAEESSRDFFDLLRDTSYDMAVQDCSIFWEPASMWSRPGNFVRICSCASPSSARVLREVPTSVESWQMWREVAPHTRAHLRGASSSSEGPQVNFAQ